MFRHCGVLGFFLMLVRVKLDCNIWIDVGLNEAEDQDIDLCSAALSGALHKSQCLDCCMC